MTIALTAQNYSPPALVSQPNAGRSPPAALATWLDTLGASSPGHLSGQKLASAAAEVTGKKTITPVSESQQLSQAATKGGPPVPATKLNPELQKFAGPPADKTGSYTGKSVESLPKIASVDELANAFAKQFTVPGVQIGILGEIHSTDALDILTKTALATQKTVGPSGRTVYVGIETPTNPTVDAALDKLNKGKMSGDSFLTIASKSLEGADPQKVAETRAALQKYVVEGHDKGLKYVFWDKNRKSENGLETVSGNRDQAGANFLAELAQKNPKAVFVVEAGFSHAQVNKALIPTETVPGIEPGVTLANLLINKVGRSHVFSIQEDPVSRKPNPADGQSNAIHEFPDRISGYRTDSPVKVPGVDAAGRLTGAKNPTYDAIVPVLIPAGGVR